MERRPSSMVAVRVIRPKFVRKGRPVTSGTRVKIADPIELPIPRGSRARDCWPTRWCAASRITCR